MEISWTDQVRSEDILQRVKKEMYPTNNTAKANWIGHTLCRNCHLKHLSKGKIEERIEQIGDKKQDVRSNWMTLMKR
jgi:hypothetical protein